MALGNTTRFGLTTWTSGDDPMGRAQFLADNLALDSLAAAWRSGPSLPAADAPQYARTFFYNETDLKLYFTDGTNWRTVGAFGASGDVYTVVAGSVAVPEGVSTSGARADHKHPVSTAAPVDIGTTNSEGNSSALARANHVHAIGANAVTNTTIAANAVDRTKINASSILKASNSLLTFDTTNGFSVNISATFFEAVGNAISLKAGAVTTTQLAGNIGKALLATDIVKATGGLSFDTTNGLSANTSATVGISANTLIVNTNSIGPTHITTAVAGSGLSGGNGSALAVSVDDSTVQVSGGSIRVKDAGITVGKLAANSITKANVNAAEIVKPTTGGLSFDTTNGLSVNYDDQTIGVSGNALFVKNSSITSGKVDGTVYARGTMTGITASTAKIHVSNGANPTTGIGAGDILFKF